jgi:hypothetical protein
MQERAKDSSEQHYLKMYTGLISQLQFVMAHGGTQEFFVNESTDWMRQRPRTQS